MAQFMSKFIIYRNDFQVFEGGAKWVPLHTHFSKIVLKALSKRKNVSEK
jgi:hypothetical protein